MIEVQRSTIAQALSDLTKKIDVDPVAIIASRHTAARGWDAVLLAVEWVHPRPVETTCRVSLWGRNAQVKSVVQGHNFDACRALAERMREDRFRAVYQVSNLRTVWNLADAERAWTLRRRINRQTMWARDREHLLARLGSHTARGTNQTAFVVDELLDAIPGTVAPRFVDDGRCEMWTRVEVCDRHDDCVASPTLAYRCRHGVDAPDVTFRHETRDPHPSRAWLRTGETAWSPKERSKYEAVARDLNTLEQEGLVGPYGERWGRLHRFGVWR